MQLLEHLGVGLVVLLFVEGVDSFFKLGNVVLLEIDDFGIILSLEQFVLGTQLSLQLLVFHLELDNLRFQLSHLLLRSFQVFFGLDVNLIKSIQ